MENVLRVRKYKRVSTDMQVAEGVSLQTQDERLNSFIDSQGWVLEGESADEGLSAKDLNRDGVQEVIRDIKLQKFDVLLVYKLDRLTRNVSDLLDLLNLMEEYNVKFKSVTEPFDTTTPGGKLFITIVAAMAQWERETTSARVHDNMLSRAEQGHRNGGVAPYGYMYDQTKKGNLIPVPEETSVVKYMYQKYETVGSQTIAKELNKKGIRTRKGRLWSDFTVRSILKNPIYAGYNRWNWRSPVKGQAFTGKEVISKLAQENFQPTVTFEEFKATQKLMESRKSMAFHTEDFYPFSGVAKCPKCESSFAGSHRINKSGNKSRFYKCVGRFTKGICDFTTVAESSLETAFLEALSMPDVADMVSKENVVVVDREALAKQLANLDGKMARAKELYIDGDSTKAEWIEKKKAYEKEKLELQELMNHVQEEISQEQIAAILSELKSNWHRMSYESKKGAIHSLFESISFEFIKPAKRGRHPEPAVLKVKDYCLRQ